MAKVLGISAFYHDSAAAMVVDGKIIAAAQEERFTRTKHTPDFPVNAIRYCLDEAGLGLDELDAVVFYDKPLLKFERLLETYTVFSPKGLTSFLKAMPVWVKEKLFIKKLIRDGLKTVESYNYKNLKLLFSEHHLSHAASAFYPSSFQSAAVLTIDGVGEWCTASIGIGNKDKIEILKELNFPHSIGLLYSSFTYFLGFTVNSGEYKLMGLAPYGIADSEETKCFVEIIKDNIVKIYDDGSIWLDQKFFRYAYGLRMIDQKKWEQLFNLKLRKPEDELLQVHCNLALAIQKVTEEIVVKLARHTHELTGEKNLCLAGGVALNCVANGLLLREGIFDNIYIQPASGDAGGALGCALAAEAMYFKSLNRNNEAVYDTMQGSYLGPEYHSMEIERMAKKTKAVFRTYKDFETLASEAAAYIAKGKVLGWFQGRMEFGPRALGNRSIIGDPSNLEMQKTINLKIKYREGFRPFAPSVLWEDRSKYFDLEADSPYMLIVAPVAETMKTKLPENYEQFGLWDRLYTKRSSLQAITHVDFSARVQTVKKKDNPRYYQLISEFKKLTGIGLLVNTSFNVRGEPIVCTPHDAYRCFMSTEMDVLVIGDYLFIKEEQPDHANKDKWLINFKPD
jgi:carbamoyltransferase